MNTTNHDNNPAEQKTTPIEIEQASPVPTPDTQHPTPSSTLNILVVEDDLFFSVRIESVLKKLGYAVHVIGDKEKALEHARQHAPALVIVNFGSDRVSPADVTRHIKELPHPPPVLGFCPHVWMPQIRPNALAAGCDLLVANSALTMRLPQFVEKLLRTE